MRQFRWAVAVLAVAVSASVGSAQPQPTGGPAPPSFGGYLNLINRGGSPALNYYGIIRPQQQLAQQATQLQNQTRQLANTQQQIGQQLNAAEFGVYGGSVFGYNPLLRGTGYIPTFNNTGHYFNTNPALGGGGGGGIRSGGIGLASGGGQVGPRAPFAGAVGSGAGASSGSSRGAASGVGSSGIRR